MGGERSMNKNNKGFTLTEVVMTMAIISLLAVLLVPKLSSVMSKAKDSGVITDFRSIQSNLDYYKVTNRALPNINEFNNLFDRDYEFSIVKALIVPSEESSMPGFQLAIRTESDETNTYGETVGATFIFIYNSAEDLFSGSYDANGIIDLGGTCSKTGQSVLEALSGYSPQNLQSIIIDSSQSNVPELIYFK